MGIIICKLHWTYGAGKPIVKRKFITTKKFRRHWNRHHGRIPKQQFRTRPGVYG